MTTKMKVNYQPPVFSTVEEERLHLKQKLAAAFRLFSKFGFDEGVAGHITARDPERKDHFWVNPFGMHFSQICASDLILCNHEGEVVEGHYPVTEPPLPSILKSMLYGLTLLLLPMLILFTVNPGLPLGDFLTQSHRMHVLSIAIIPYMTTLPVWF